MKIPCKREFRAVSVHKYPQWELSGALFHQSELKGSGDDVLYQAFKILSHEGGIRGCVGGALIIIS